MQGFSLTPYSGRSGKMSIASLEKELRDNLQIVLKNPKLKIKDILAWSSGKCEPMDDSEIEVRDEKLQLNCVVKKTVDKR